MKKIFMQSLLALCVCCTAGSAFAAEQTAISRDEANAMQQEIRELKTLMADMNSAIKQQAQPRTAEPADMAVSAPCYDSSYHHEHTYRCYPHYRNHH